VSEEKTDEKKSPPLEAAIADLKKEDPAKTEQKRASCFLKEGDFEIYITETSDASSLDLMLYSETQGSVSVSRLQLVGNRVYSGIDGSNWYNLTLKDQNEALLDMGLLVEGYQEFVLKNCAL
jgi:hypothetical protein